MNDEYDYRLDVPSVERIDEMSETKILVAATTVSESEAKNLFEKEKLEIFKTLFKRPKDSEVEIKNIEKGLEPYLIVGGRYELRYLTERTYDIDLLDDTVSVFILGEERTVQKEEEGEAEVEIKKEKKGFFDGLFGGSSKKKSASKPELQIAGIEHVYIDKEITEARNYNRVSINPESLADAELNEVGSQFLTGEGSIIPSKYIDIEALIQEIIEEYAVRPEHAQRILFEKLTITDKKIIFYPIYWAEMVYKGSKTKHVRLDAITKKIEVPKGTRYAPSPSSLAKAISETDDDEPTKEVESGSLNCPGCGEKVEADDVFCEHCGVKLQ